MLSPSFLSAVREVYAEIQPRGWLDTLYRSASGINFDCNYHVIKSSSGSPSVKTFYGATTRAELSAILDPQNVGGSFRITPYFKKSALLVTRSIVRHGDNRDHQIVIDLAPIAPGTPDFEQFSRLTASIQKATPDVAKATPDVASPAPEEPSAGPRPAQLDEPAAPVNQTESRKSQPQPVKPAIPPQSSPSETIEASVINPAPAEPEKKSIFFEVLDRIIDRVFDKIKSMLPSADDAAAMLDGVLSATSSPTAAVPAAGSAPRAGIERETIESIGKALFAFDNNEVDSSILTAALSPFREAIVKTPLYQLFSSLSEIMELTEKVESELVSIRSRFASSAPAPDAAVSAESPKIRLLPASRRQLRPDEPSENDTENMKGGTDGLN